MPTRRKSRKSRKYRKYKKSKCATYRSRKKKIRAGMIGLPRVERVKKLFCDPLTHKFFESPVILQNGESYSNDSIQPILETARKKREKNIPKFTFKNRLLEEIVENIKTVQKGILRIVDPRKEESLGLFMCPITQDVFVYPVVASDGYTYSKYALKKWALTSINKHRVPRSPFTREPLLMKTRNELEIAPNIAVEEILRHLADHNSVLRYSEDRYREARRLKLEVDSAAVLFQRMNLDESPGIPRAYQNRRPQTPRPTTRRFDEDWAWAESPPRNSRLNPPRSPPRTPPRIPNSFDANGSPVVRSSQTRRVPPPPTRRPI